MCLKVVGRGLVGHWTIWVIGPYGTLVLIKFIIPLFQIVISLATT